MLVGTSHQLTGQCAIQPGLRQWGDVDRGWGVWKSCSWLRNRHANTRHANWNHQWIDWVLHALSRSLKPTARTRLRKPKRSVLAVRAIGG